MDWTVVDIDGGYGLFAEEMRLLRSRPPLVIEPSPHLADVCHTRELTVVEKFLEDVVIADLPEGPKAFVSFELFEHVHNPELFLKHLPSLMSSGDLFVFTTLSGTGLDIQVLLEVEVSHAASPPEFLQPRVGEDPARAGRLPRP